MNLIRIICLACHLLFLFWTVGIKKNANQIEEEMWSWQKRQLNYSGAQAAAPDQTRGRDWHQTYTKKNNNHFEQMKLNIIVCIFMIIIIVIAAIEIEWNWDALESSSCLIIFVNLYNNELAVSESVSLFRVFRDKSKGRNWIRAIYHKQSKKNENENKNTSASVMLIIHLTQIKNVNHQRVNA